MVVPGGHTALLMTFGGTEGDKIAGHFLPAETSEKKAP